MNQDKRSILKEQLRKMPADWHWHEDRVIEDGANLSETVPREQSPLRSFFVSKIYADHNQSQAVKESLAKLLENLDQGLGLNFGAGNADLHPRVVNLDIFDGPTVDIVGASLKTPFPDASLDLIICQEVIEHITHPSAAIQEFHRVLKPGGSLFLQAPFQIGFHPGPHDYWRFSREAYEVLLDQKNWDIQKLDTTVGFASGFYRITVEFFATLASCVHQRLYLPTKAGVALCLYPIKFLDSFERFTMESDRIAGGYYCIAQKR